MNIDLWLLDSKYNVRRCDVLVQNKQFMAQIFSLIEYFFKMASEPLVKLFHVDR